MLATALEGRVNSWGQCQHHLFATRHIWLFGRLFSRITNVNKSGEFIEKFLSKLTFSPLACLSDAFIQTPNIPMKPLDLMPCKWSKYRVRSFTSIRIRLIKKKLHPRLAYFYKLKGHTKLRQNFLLFFREANFEIETDAKRFDTWITRTISFVRFTQFANSIPLEASRALHS